MKFTEVVKEEYEHNVIAMLHDGADHNFCNLCQKPIILRNGNWTHDGQ